MIEVNTFVEANRQKAIYNAPPFSGQLGFRYFEVRYRKRNGDGQPIWALFTDQERFQLYNYLQKLCQEEQVFAVIYYNRFDTTSFKKYKEKNLELMYLKSVVSDNRIWIYDNFDNNNFYHDCDYAFKKLIGRVFR
jgi:hypothetical protein